MKTRPQLSTGAPTSVPIEIVFSEIKSALKCHGITYAELGRRLGITESAVKKLFTSKDCSYRRLQEICSILDLSLSDLISSAQAPEVKEFRFSEKQERFLVKSKLCFYLFWKLVQERLSIQEIQSESGLSFKEIFSGLRLLDGIGLIRLHEGDRIGVPPMELVKWMGNGPLMSWIKQDWANQIIRDVISKDRPGDLEHYSLRYYQLTPAVAEELLTRIRELDREFAQRSLREMKLGSKKRVLIRMVSAIAPGSYVKTPPIEKL